MLAEGLIIVLDGARRGTSKPYHRQIYEQIRGAILEGQLQAGDRLPATRELAGQLGIARNTVGRAYDDLLGEGYLESRIGSGTYVSSQLGAERHVESEGMDVASSPVDDPRSKSSWAKRATEVAPAATAPQYFPLDFRPGTPDWGAFPRTLWLRLLGRALRQKSGHLTGYGEPAGYYPLRQAIARHLAVSRSVIASPNQVVIVSGSQQAIDLLVRLRVDPGDTVALEDPGYPEARQAFAAAGARVLHLPVDEEGLDVQELAGKGQMGEPLPRLVYVTPSHQFPTGATLSLSRRLALLEWAAKRDVLIVEDDYDSEFRYAGRPVESLQGLDRDGRVVYVGTFSTVLFPPLRVGYVVLPPDLVGPLVQAKSLADRQTPTLEQLALADFLEEGHFERHLRRMRRLAASRREVLLAAIRENLGTRVESPGAAAGMHVMLRFPALSSETQSAAPVEASIVERSAARGLGLYPVGPCCARPPRQPAIMLGFVALPPSQIQEGIRRLAGVIQELGIGTSR